METSLPRLKPTNLRELARQAIQGQIITGGVEPGAIYAVSHFTAQLGVSATPVREALFDLAHEGLVEIVRNRGFRIVEPSEHDLDEIFELRLLLEVPAIEMAAGRLTPEDVRECMGLADATADFALRRDLVGFHTADTDFHLRLLKPISNRRLVEMIGRLRNQVRLPGLRSLAEAGTLVAAADEHRHILEAVGVGDVDLAARLLHDHLQHTRGIWAGRPESESSSAAEIENRSAVISRAQAQRPRSETFAD